MTKTIDEQSLTDWLSEHGPYEVCMLRYCLKKMHESTEQLDYNAHFDAFSVHARVLIDFFTGRRKDDLVAIKFVPSYQAPKRDQLQTAINRIDEQVAHPTKHRTIVPGEKIQRSDCDELADWVEAALSKFLKGMETPRRGQWSDAKARDDLANRIFITAGTQPTASSATPQTSTVVV